jgi:ABC-type arginine/histidine transport system permease subunit
MHGLFLTVTLPDMITQVTTIVTDTLPDFSVYVAAGVVVAIAAGMARRFLNIG